MALNTNAPSRVHCWIIDGTLLEHELWALSWALNGIGHRIVEVSTYDWIIAVRKAKLQMYAAPFFNLLLLLLFFFLVLLWCVCLFGHCRAAEDGLTPDKIDGISAPRLQRYFETKGSHLAERTWREWNTLASSIQPRAMEYLEKVGTAIESAIKSGSPFLYDVFISLFCFLAKTGVQYPSLHSFPERLSAETCFGVH